MATRHNSGKAHYLVLICLIIAASCRQKTPAAEAKAPAQPLAARLSALSIDSVSGNESLLRFEPIRLGMTYQEVKDMMPANVPVSLEEEITGDSTLQQSLLPIKVLGANGKLELNFKNKTLYSYYYSAPVHDQHSGDSLFRALHLFYEKQYGAARDETAQEPDRNSHSSFWHTPAFDLALTYDTQASLLSWGIQEKQAYLP